MIYQIIHAMTGQTLKMTTDEKAAREYFAKIENIDGIVYLVECRILETKGKIE